MKKVIVVGSATVAGILMSLALSACYHEGPMKTEKAEVIQLAYIPATSGSGVGMSMKGEAVITSVDSPEVWAVVLRCRDHNKTFSVRGKEIYSRCRVGQIVTLYYCELLNDADGTLRGYHTKEVR